MQVYSPVPTNDVVATEGFSTMEGIARTRGDAMITDAKPSSAELLSKMAQDLWDLRDPSNWDLIYLTNLSEVFYENVTGKNVSDILDLLKKGVREEDWKDMVTHGRHLAVRSTSS
jgi:hypothetical protein